MVNSTTARRVNGFELPFHPLQVVSWVVFGLDVLVFFVFGVPLIEGSAKAVVAFFFVASVVVLVFAAHQATICDPADKHIFKQEDAECTPAKDEDAASLPYCTMCNCPVLPRSKHCRSCNKCVHVFDHHCMWLNNCIGEYNYRFFAMCIGSVAVMTGICLSCCTYLFVDLYINENSFEERLNSSPIFGGAPKEFSAGLLITLMCINLPLFTLDMQLVFMHIFLTSQKLTTFDYIMHKHHMQMEALEKRSDQYKADKKTTSSFPRSVKTLPRCMDWIVFKPGRQRSHKKDKIEKIEVPTCDLDPYSDIETAPEEPPRQATPQGVEVGGQPSSQDGQPILAGAAASTPSPPGSTDGRESGALGAGEPQPGEGAGDDVSEQPTDSRRAEGQPLALLGDKATICSGANGMISRPGGVNQSLADSPVAHSANPAALPPAASKV